MHVITVWRALNTIQKQVITVLSVLTTILKQVITVWRALTKRHNVQLELSVIKMGLELLRNVTIVPLVLTVKIRYALGRASM